MIRSMLLLAAALPLAAAAPVPRLTADGWSPLKIGMTRAQVERAAGADAQPGADGGPDPARCDEFHPRRTPAGLIVMLEDGQLTRVSAHRRGVASVRGIRVGDPASKVRAAYRGERLADEPHTYVDPPGRYLTAWIGTEEAPRGIRYEIDAGSRVSAIHAGTEAIEYVEGCL